MCGTHTHEPSRLRLAVCATHIGASGVCASALAVCATHTGALRG